MRYTPNSDADVKDMLKATGLASLDDLFSDIPEEIKSICLLPESPGMSEMALRQDMESLALENLSAEDCPIFLGVGCYDHYIPAAVTHLLQRSDFYTTYTPYLPEISQGILQSIFEYQSLICNLTGMDVANASLYCGGSALAQACQVAAETTKRKRILIPATVNPDYTRIAQTYSISGSMEVEIVPEKNGLVDCDAMKQTLDDTVAAVVIPYPNFYGNLEDIGRLVQLAHDAKALAIMAVDPFVLALLKSPSEWGADIAVGDAQVLGNPMSFGGPHLGFMAVTNKLLRKIPGRLVGQTNDANGNRMFVLTLQAREQHIRREKANSNICSNEALNALAASMYLAFVGPQGFKQAAMCSHHSAQYARNQLKEAGFKMLHDAPVFREFAVAVADPAGLNRWLLDHGIIGGYEIEGGMILAFTEKRQREEIDELVRLMREYCFEDAVAVNDTEGGIDE